MLQIVESQKVKWVDIKNPAQEDIKYLKERFRFHHLILDELITPTQRPRVERHENYLFMIIHYPFYHKERRETKSRELDIVVTKDAVVTTHYGSILPLKTLLDSCASYAESRQIYMGESSGHLLYYILIGVWKNCLLKLDQIDIRIDSIERKIFMGREREMVKEISLVKTDIINFWRIIEPQGQILESLAKEGIGFWKTEELRAHFEDIMGTYAQAWNTLKMHRETILAFEDTNQSLLTTKTNEIIRTLTIFSVVLLPLTLIASLWGMNTNYLPLTEWTFDFWLIFALMVSITTFMIIYFKKKGWL